MVTKLEIRELGIDEVRALALEYTDQRAVGSLAKDVTKLALIEQYLGESKEGTQFFLIDWYGYSTPLDVEIGGVVITQTRDGEITSRYNRVGKYVRLIGEGLEGSAQHRVLAFLHPSAAGA